MSEARPSLGELYEESYHPTPEPPGSLGEQYAGWLDALSGRASTPRSGWVGEDPTSVIPQARLATELARERERRLQRSRRIGQEWSAARPPTPEEELPLEPIAGMTPGPVAEPGIQAGIQPGIQPGIETGAASAGTGGSGATGSGNAALARSSAIMAAGTLVSKVLGFLRVVLLAAALPATTRAANVFDTANTLPNMIYILLAGGVISAIFVPQITRALRHPDGGKAYTDRLLTLALSILLIITVVFTAAAPLLYKLFDGQATGSRLHLGVAFSLICLPQIFFYGIYTLFGEVLNARSRFGAYMWSPVLANVIMIAGLVVFLVVYPRGPAPDAWTPGMIATLAGSATLGIVAQALVLIWPLKRAGYTFKPDFHFRGVGLRGVSKIAGWAFGAVILQQVGLWVTTRILNAVPDNFGGRFAQSTAYTLFMLPHGIVTVSLVTALYTRMSNAAAEGDKGQVVDDLRTGFRLSGLASIPVTIGSFVLILPLAGAFFGGHGSRWAIGAATIAMMIGLVPFTFAVLEQRIFFAFEDARTPFLIQAIGTAVTIVCALIASTLPYRMVGPGVAFGQTISFLAQAIAGFIWVRRLIGRIPMGDVLQVYARLACAAIVATLCALVVHLASSSIIGGRLGDMITLVVGGSLFAVVYVVAAKRLRVAEIDVLVRQLAARVPGLSRG